MEQKELMKLIAGAAVGDDEVTVFPASRFEVEGLDEHKVALSVHFYRNPEAFDRDETRFMTFLVPIEGALGLSQMLSSAVAALCNRPSEH